MFITVSGMVGSGKTTVANRLLTLLQARGVDASCLRFQALPCFTFLRSPLRRRQRTSEGRATPAGTQARTIRWSGYRRKRLTAGVTLVWVARIVAFRIYRLFWRSNRVYVLNRYFYDLLVH